MSAESDRMDYLEKVLAVAARVVEAQTDLTAIKGSRRRIIDEQVALMREVALGRSPTFYQGRRMDEKAHLQASASKGGAR